MRVSLLVFLFSATGLVAANSTVEVPADYWRPCPLPSCKSCPSNSQLRQPGIGFALETGYGTAVVRLHDGTHHQIATIQGNSEYKALMHRLATGPMIRELNNFDTYWEMLRHAKAVAQRRLNKLLGRPATPETAILASMVTKLQDVTEQWLKGEPVTAAVITSPERIRLTDRELDDVCYHSKLKNLMAIPDSFEDLHATSAAYAGYGRGLCAHYTDAYECEYEAWVFPYHFLLHIDFSRDSLSGTIKGLKTAMDGSLRESFIAPDLGLAQEEGQVTSTSDIHDSPYWTMVSSRIHELVVSFKLPVTDLLLTGESAGNPQFQAVLRDTLHDIIAPDALAMFAEIGEESTSPEDQKYTFEFATARGAAEVAKRRQEGPIRCRQTDECKRRREMVHQTVFRKQGV